MRKGKTMSEDPRYYSNHYSEPEEVTRPDQLSRSTQSPDCYHLESQGQQYSYAPVSPELETPRRQRGLVLTALFLLLLFVGSLLGMLYVYRRGLQRAQRQFRENVVTWDDWADAEDADDSEMTETTLAREVQEPTELAEGEAADAAALREPAFSLEAATRQQRGDQASWTIAEIAKAGLQSVVAISTEVELVDLFGDVRHAAFAGSGFIISRDGYIATNSHVIKNAKKILVKMSDGVVYPADLVASDPSSDLAVIKLRLKSDERPELVPAVLGNSDELVVGELAVAIGNPTGQLEGTVTAGIISALNREINFEGLELNMIQTSAAVNSGNSGGALFNSFGEVIGVITGKISAAGQGASFEGLGFAIPITEARPVIEDLIRYGYVRGRVSLGIYSEAVSAELAQHYGIADRAGILVVDLIPGSAAVEAGLRKGDLIVAIDGEPMTTVADVNRYKRNLKPGDTVTLDVYRAGEKREVKLVLQEYEPGK